MKERKLSGQNWHPEHTCSVESFQQKVKKLFVDILADVDLRGEQNCPCVRNCQVLTAESKGQ